MQKQQTNVQEKIYINIYLLCFRLDSIWTFKNNEILANDLSTTTVRAMTTEILSHVLLESH